MGSIMEIFRKTRFVTLLIIAIFAMSAIGYSSPSGAKYSVGSGDADWWTTYPSQSPSSGSEVSHPSWVLDALKNKTVVIYVHKGCSYCKPQTDAMAEIVKEYGTKFTYYDISAESNDKRAEQALQAYDPNGEVSYVPMTIIVTLAPDSKGKVVTVWHSTEEVTGKTWIEDYVKDAISYYDSNSASWKK